MPEIADWARMRVVNSGTGVLTLEPIANFPTFAQMPGFEAVTTSMYYTGYAAGFRERGTATYTRATHAMSARAPSRTWSATTGPGTTAPLPLPTGTVIFCAIGEDELNTINSRLATVEATGGGSVPVDGSITNAKLANMAAGLMKGRAVGSLTGVPIDMNGAQIRAAAELTQDDGIVWVQLPITAPTDDVTVGDGKAYVSIPESFNGFNLHRVVVDLYAAGVTGTNNVQIARDRNGVVVDTLSTAVTVDSAEKSSLTAAVAYVINTVNDDLLTGDRLRIDWKAASTTPGKGALVSLGIKEP